MIGPKKTTLCMKYANKVQFCFGITRINNTETQLKLLEHAKVILKFKNLVKEEISRLKVLTSNCPLLVVD